MSKQSKDGTDEQKIFSRAGPEPAGITGIFIMPYLAKGKLPTSFSTWSTHSKWLEPLHRRLS